MDAQNAIHRSEKGVQKQFRMRDAYPETRRYLDFLVRGPSETGEARVERWDCFYYVGFFLSFCFFVLSFHKWKNTLYDELQRLMNAGFGQVRKNNGGIGPFGSSETVYLNLDQLIALFWFLYLWVM